MESKKRAGKKGERKGEKPCHRQSTASRGRKGFFFWSAACFSGRMVHNIASPKHSNTSRNSNYPTGSWPLTHHGQSLVFRLFSSDCFVVVQFKVIASDRFGPLPVWGVRFTTDVRTPTVLLGRYQVPGTRSNAVTYIHSRMVRFLVTIIYCNVVYSGVHTYVCYVIITVCIWISGSNESARLIRTQQLQHCTRFVAILAITSSSTPKPEEC